MKAATAALCVCVRAIERETADVCPISDFGLLTFRVGLRDACRETPERRDLNKKEEGEAEDGEMSVRRVMEKSWTTRSLKRPKDPK